MSEVRVAALDAGLGEAWARLFVAAGCSCYCRYWHFAGDKNAWLDRCARAPDESLREQLASVAARDPTAGGLVALVDDDVVGWMKVAPRAALPKLRKQSVYRALDLGDEAGVLSIGCLLVHPEHRGRGIARALVAAADAYARTRGATALEAYPRRTVEPVHAEEVWMGPEALFLEAGFVPVAGEAPYLVYRKAL